MFNRILIGEKTSEMKDDLRALKKNLIQLSFIQNVALEEEYICEIWNIPTLGRREIVQGQNVCALLSQSPTKIGPYGPCRSCYENDLTRVCRRHAFQAYPLLF